MARNKLQVWWWPEPVRSPARSWWPRAHIRCPAQTRRAEWPHPAWPSGQPRPGPVCYHQPGQCNPHPSQASAVRRQCRWDDLFFKDSQTLSEAGLRPGARKYRRIFRNNRFTTELCTAHRLIMRQVMRVHNLMWTFWKINYNFPNNNQNWSMCVSVSWCSCVAVIRPVWPLRTLRARPVHLERLILRWEGEVEQRGPSVGTLDHEKLYNWDWSQSCHTSHTASVTLTVTLSRIVTQAQPIIHHNITSSHSLNNANRTCHLMVYDQLHLKS